MTSPFYWLSEGRQVSLCIALLALSLASGLFMAKQAAALNARLPNGILDLQTPWTTQGADRLLATLGPDGVGVAKKHIVIDSALLLTYPLALSLLCALLAGLTGGKIGALGVMLAWGALLAGPFDAVENAAIWKMLSGSTGFPWPQLTAISATLKFTAIFGALGFIGAGAVAALVSCLRAG